MTKLEKSRLDDFKKILTYHLASKIKHDFKGHYELYYKAPSLWKKWQNKEIKYDQAIYKFIVLFNATGLTKLQVRAIFGKTPEKKWLRWAELISSDEDIRIFNQGTIFMSGRRFQVTKRYQLPYEFIKSIFDDKQLLAKVLNAGSDYYTDRQRRLIFTQINKKNSGYHYKTNKQLKEDITEEQMIEDLMADFDMDVPRE